MLGAILGLLSGVLAAVVPQHTIGTLGAGDLLGGARGMAGGSRLTRLRSGLVLVQVAIALVLIVSAGLLVRTVMARLYGTAKLRMARFHPRFIVEHVLARCSYEGRDPRIDEELALDAAQHLYTKE